MSANPNDIQFDDEISARAAQATQDTQQTDDSDDEITRRARGETIPVPPPSKIVDPSRHAIGDHLVDQLHAMGSSAYHSVVGGLKGIGSLAFSPYPDADKAARAVADEQAKAYQAPPEAPSAFERKAGPEMRAAIERSRYQPPDVGAFVGDTLERAGAPPLVSALGKAAPAALSFLAPGSAGEASALGRAAPLAREAAPVGFPNRAPVEQPRSMGAAEVAPDLSRAPQAYQEERAAAAQRGPINRDVEERHLEAHDVGVNLSEGAATRDAQLYSDEQNMAADPDTGGHILRNDVKNDAALVNKLQETRREATPDVVHRDNTDHGQQAVSDIKRMANDRLDEEDAAWQTARDALKKETGNALFDGNDLLEKAAANLEESGRADFLPSSVQNLLNKIKANDGNLSFKTWENDRSILADEQRDATGSAKTAISNVRDAYEKAEPLGASAQVKPLFDRARAVTRANKEDIERNPAYKAVTEDTVPKVKREDGKYRYNPDADSPLADGFIRNFATGEGPKAARANILNMKTLMGKYPSFSEAIEGASLNNLRDAAGINEHGLTGNKGFSSASYGAARSKMERKVDALLSPESADMTAKIARVARNAKEAPPGDFVNRSKTAIVANRMAAQPVPGGPGLGRTLAAAGGNFATNALLAKTTGPAAPFVRHALDYGLAKRAATKKAAAEAASEKAIADAKEEYARQVTKPGAGLNYQGP